MMSDMHINGLVLSGGQSTRMGKDKGEIHYYNTSQRKYLYYILSHHCQSTFISCNEEQSKHIIDTPIIKDVYENIGPLGGILSAFQINSNTAWLVVACDLPFVNDETIVYLINHRNPSKMATVFWDIENKFPEPMITIWEPCAYSVLLQLVKQGYHSPRKALINADVEILNAPDPLVLKNVNTTEEYEEVLSLLHK